MTKYVKVGVAVLSSSKQSVRLEINDDPTQAFPTVYYVNVDSLQSMLNGEKKTAKIIKLEA